MTGTTGRAVVSKRCLGLAVAVLALSVGGALAAVRLFTPRTDPEPEPSETAACFEPSGAILAAGAAPGLRPGLRAEYFPLDGDPDDIPAVDVLAVPAVARVDRQINFGSTSGAFARTPLVDRFTVCWTGVIRAPRAGRYRFFTTSDDGSRLTIDHRLVVDNGGLHEARERGGELDLAAGDHEIRLEYFDSTGPAACALSWEGPGIPKDVVPEDALFHRGEK